MKLAENIQVKGKWCDRQSGKKLTTEVDLKMQDPESIHVTFNAKIYSFKRTNGNFASKFTIDEGEIFSNEILGKFEAIYEEDQKFMTFQTIEAKGSGIRIRSNGYADTKMPGKSVGFLYYDNSGIAFDVVGGWTDIGRFAFHSGGKSMVLKRTGSLKKDLLAVDGSLLEVQGVEVMKVNSVGSEMPNVGGIDEEAGSGNYPDRCNMVLLRDGTKNWKYKALPEGVEIDWNEINPQKSHFTEKSHQEPSSMLMAEGKIQEKPVPLLRMDSSNVRLQERVKSYNKSFGTTPYELELTANLDIEGVQVQRAGSGKA